MTEELITILFAITRHVPFARLRRANSECSGQEALTDLLDASRIGASSTLAERGRRGAIVMPGLIDTSPGSCHSAAAPTCFPIGLLSLYAT